MILAARGHCERVVPQLYRIAGRLGTIIEIDPDTLCPPEAPIKDENNG